MDEKDKKLILYGILILILISVFFVIKYNINKKKKVPVQIYTYDVVFDTDGGTYVETQKVEEGKRAIMPAKPTKEGYIFDGWSLEGELYSFASIVTKDITLKANWKILEAEKEYITIFFNSNGGTDIQEKIIEKGQKVTHLESPQRDGYIFVEWQLNNNKFNLDTEINENITLIAVWEKTQDNVSASTNNKPEVPSTPVSTPNSQLTPVTPNNSQKPQETKKYTVTFNSNNGTSVASQTVVEGGKVIKPSNPTRNGYNFVKWVKDNGAEFDFNTAISGNITLTAIWNEIVKAKYTVSFNTKGGNSVQNQIVTEGEKASAPANPSKNGYNFGGWTLNGNTYDFNSPVNSNITLEAKWHQKNYTISASAVDQYSPDRILTVKEDGTAITVKSIRFTDGVLLCNGNNTVISASELSGESSFKVELLDGSIVIATLN